MIDRSPRAGLLVTTAAWVIAGFGVVADRLHLAPDWARPVPFRDSSRRFQHRISAGEFDRDQAPEAALGIAAWPVVLMAWLANRLLSPFLGWFAVVHAVALTVALTLVVGAVILAFKRLLLKRPKWAARLPKGVTWREELLAWLVAGTVMLLVRGW